LVEGVRLSHRENQTGEGTSVLVCDDEASLRELIRATLGDRYRVYEAADGDEALELARSLRPRVVILDVMLPKRNGLEVLAELRADKELAGTRVIIVTAWSHAHVSVAAAGADHFLEKPFEPDELLALVDGLVEES
jgi:DNA-binding response OmpR family regulator